LFATLVKRRYFSRNGDIALLFAACDHQLVVMEDTHVF